MPNHLPVCSFPRRRLALALLCAWSVWPAAQAANPPDKISLDEARAAVDAGRAVLIDIREPEEHATGVAPGARRLPLSQLEQRLAEIPRSPDQPVLLICRTQNRSNATVQRLRALGIGNVSAVQGGMSEWARRGWPMDTPPR